MKKISVGVCCYNEEDNIELMYEALTKELQNLKEYDYEIVFADNDSIDKSQDILRRIAAKDKHVKAIFNQTNFGPDRSGINLYENISGDVYIGIPCDFQEPPEMIPDFIKEWENGYDVVYGQKTKSKESHIKYFFFYIYYSIISKMSDHPQMDQVTGFGLMDKKVLDIVSGIQDQDPEYNIRNLVSEFGFKTKLLPYTQKKRERGKSSYSPYKYFDFAITSLVNTSVKPLHFMTIIGFLMSIICFIVAFVYLIYKLFNWNTFNAGIAPLVIGVFFVLGVQLFCIGMIGEYVAVLIRRVTKKPVVIEKEKLNFDMNEDEASE